MTDKFLEKTNRLIANIAKQGEANKKVKSLKLLPEFIKQFYQHVSHEYLSEHSFENLYGAASSLWEFILGKKSAEPQRVRVFNPTKKADGFDSQRTILDVISQDMPFLIDSVTAELTNQGFKIHQIIHPVLDAERDIKGNIISLQNSKKTEGSLESVMHFEITHIEGKDLLKKLELDIGNILDYTRLAVFDWRKMLQKLNETLEMLSNRTIYKPGNELDEGKDFLKWLGNNNFTFLGFIEYRFKQNSQKNDITLETVKNSQLGIFKISDSQFRPLGLSALSKEALKTSVRNLNLIQLTKSTRKSPVHRSVQMDYVGIKIFGKNGEVLGERLFLGLFTSGVYYQSATLIPIIRRKIDAIVRRSGFSKNGYNGKALMTVLETYPRDELLQISENELFETSLAIVELSKRPRVRFFARRDSFGRFVSCMIFVPREGFTAQLRERIQHFLEKEFGGQVSDHNTQLSTDAPLVRLHSIIKVDNGSGKVKTGKISEIESANIEKKLAEIVTSWYDGLQASLIKTLGERQGENLCYKYGESFPESYIARYHFGGAVIDIIKMEEALQLGTTTLDFYKLLSDKNENYQLKIYHPKNQITLSEILPMLENMGFHAIDEISFHILPRNSEDGIWLHHFSLRDISIRKSERANLKEVKPNFEEALAKVHNRTMEDDAFNKLILRAGMKTRDVELLRGLSRYLAQTSFTYSHIFMAKAVARQPDIASLLVQLFYQRFELHKKIAKAEIANTLKELDSKLASVTNVAEDRIARRFLDTILATLRTNFFQKNKDGTDKKYISFKFDSAQVPDLPLPKPYAEIFVYSYHSEGIHLRGGKVARGGIRWSDRREDFRTEVLGLMKAQMVKNSVIVPVGSKGGFVIKHEHDDLPRDELLKKGIESYKTLLRGLLDITDNIINGKVVPPKDVIRHDPDDPYLVVAADKGTATFSDIANSVSAEYNFWLGDAFASGGSAGYDHKKMAITAKGAWISVTRHFHEIGMNIGLEDFSVVGIGDMSGDVFGNGMLLSNHIKLVAAFNHQHIFIDPNPDPEKSLEERQRLFDLPRSSWADYDEKLISKGGGIFERKTKVLKLTSEIKKLLDIEKDSVTSEELIRFILKAKVDLLWNGGIGTYVKSSHESNDSVGDRTNDSLRINGNELRSKVVGEGGNLGFTQLGRIEYALKGGKINTDAIDNSAGVDCSDHEVNIKIAFQQAMTDGKITLNKRNQLLVKMTDEVANLVLRDNFLQTQAITLAEAQGVKVLEQQSRLITKLERAGLLDRKIEFLPEEEEIDQRFADKVGLTRPEIAVMLAYSKIALYNELLDSNLPDDPYFTNDLIIYFPLEMQKKFAAEIEAHPLRREIIATFVTNSMVNRVGASFSHNVADDTGMKGCDIARSYTIARDIFNLRPLWREIEGLDGKVKVSTQIAMFSDIWHLIERTTAWFLRNSRHPLNVSEVVKTYKEGTLEIEKSLHKIMEHVNKKAFEDRYKKYLSLDVPETLAKKIAYLEPLSSAPDIVKIAKSAKLGARIAGEVYFELGTRLSLGWLRYSAANLPSDNYWQRLSVKTLTNQIYDQQMRITGEIIKGFCKGDKCEIALEDWEQANSVLLERYDALINDLRAQGNLDSAMLVVAINGLGAIKSV